MHARGIRTTLHLNFKLHDKRREEKKARINGANGYAFFCSQHAGIYSGEGTHPPLRSDDARICPKLPWEGVDLIGIASYALRALL